jgi:hypothetical protein
MRKPLLRFALAGAIACAILAPALLLSGQRPLSALQGQDIYKGPPVFTIGPPMTPAELAAREQEKLLSIAQGEWWSGEYVSSPERRYLDVPGTASLPKAEHTGLTSAEIQKLIAFQNRPPESIDYKPGPLDPKKQYPVLRNDAPLRPLGEEGLTPQERAKLEASRTLDKKDEGGRSR